MLEPNAGARYRGGKAPPTFLQKKVVLQLNSVLRGTKENRQIFAKIKNACLHRFQQSTARQSSSCRHQLTSPRPKLQDGVIQP